MGVIPGPLANGSDGPPMFKRLEGAQPWPRWNTDQNAAKSRRDSAAALTRKGI
jgi:hypothetical protein